MTREELIAALENAEGPNKVLDQEIYWQTLPDVRRTVLRNNERAEKLPGAIVGISVTAPRYTSSIDAALALVPDGWFVSMGRFSDGWYAQVSERSGVVAPIYRGSQKPAAIALCIAALKARGETDGR